MTDDAGDSLPFQIGHPKIDADFEAGPVLAAGMLGQLVGDALGVPHEFTPPDRLPPPSQIEMQPPPGFNRAHLGVRPGTWSDDGAHALCLLECGRLDLKDIGRRLVRWLHGGHTAGCARTWAARKTAGSTPWRRTTSIRSRLRRSTSGHCDRMPHCNRTRSNTSTSTRSISACPRRYATSTRSTSSDRRKRSAGVRHSAETQAAASARTPDRRHAVNVPQYDELCAGAGNCDVSEFA